MKSILCGFAFLFSVSAFAKLDADDQRELAKAKAKAAQMEPQVVTQSPQTKPALTGQDLDKAEGAKAMKEARLAREAKAKADAKAKEEARKKALEKLFGKDFDPNKELTPEEEAKVKTAADQFEHQGELEASPDIPTMVRRLGNNYGDPNTNQQSSVSYNQFGSRVPEYPGAYEANKSIRDLDTSPYTTADCGAKSLRVRDIDAEALIQELSHKKHFCNIGDKDRLTCMVCNLFHEAGNQQDYGQIAVGQTVMSRTFSSAYDTKTVCDTVWSPSQYSWTMDKVVRPENRDLPTDETVLRRLVTNANKALCKGPGLYTNYYAWQIVSPDWAKPDTACYNSGIRKLQAHNFCAIGNLNDRELNDVLRAEGVTDASGNVKTDSGSTGSDN